MLKAGLRIESDSRAGLTVLSVCGGIVTYRIDGVLSLAPLKLEAAEFVRRFIPA